MLSVVNTKGNWNVTVTCDTCGYTQEFPSRLSEANDNIRKAGWKVIRVNTGQVIIEKSFCDGYCEDSFDYSLILNPIH